MRVHGRRLVLRVCCYVQDEIVGHPDRQLLFWDVDLGRASCDEKDLVLRPAKKRHSSVSDDSLAGQIDDPGMQRCIRAQNTMCSRRAQLYQVLCAPLFIYLGTRPELGASRARPGMLLL